MCVCVSECVRSEEHTSELQSHLNLVCRLLLEKKTQRIVAETLIHTCTRCYTHDVTHTQHAPPPQSRQSAQSILPITRHHRPLLSLKQSRAPPNAPPHPPTPPPA